MRSTIRLVSTAAAAFFASAAVCSPACAAVPRAEFQPHAVVGTTEVRGADGGERTVMCPPDENVLGGGFTVSAPDGAVLGAIPGDVLTSRPTVDATGWTVAVKKLLAPGAHGVVVPADLTVEIVCTEGEVTPGG